MAVAHLQHAPAARAARPPPQRASCLGEQCAPALVPRTTWRRPHALRRPPCQLAGCARAPPGLIELLEAGTTIGELTKEQCSQVRGPGCEAVRALCG